MEKRWWLWKWWDSADDRVYDFSDELAKYKAKRCTEVRLVPVDAVVCEKGSREWAVVMAMRGKDVGHRTAAVIHMGPHSPREILDHDIAPFDQANWCELPAEEPVEKENPMDDGLVTLRVAPDSLEAAIAGTRRGERWVVDGGQRSLVIGTYNGAVWEGTIGGDHRYPYADGWHRVEEPPLKCPACAGDDLLYLPIENDYQFMCNSCGVRGPRRANKSEAREAFRRMGGGR